MHRLFAKETKFAKTDVMQKKGYRLGPKASNLIFEKTPLVKTWLVWNYQKQAKNMFLPKHPYDGENT